MLQPERHEGAAPRICPDICVTDDLSLENVRHVLEHLLSKARRHGGAGGGSAKSAKGCAGFKMGWRIGAQIWGRIPMIATVTNVAPDASRGSCGFEGDMLTDEGKSPKAKSPSLRKHRVFRIGITVREDVPGQLDKLSVVTSAIKMLINNIQGVKPEGRWIMAHVCACQIKPSAAASSSSSSTSAAACTSLVGARQTRLWYVMVHMVCGNAGKVLSSVKESIENMIVKSSAADGKLVLNTKGAPSAEL